MVTFRSFFKLHKHQLGLASQSPLRYLPFPIDTFIAIGILDVIPSAPVPLRFVAFLNQVSV